MSKQANWNRPLALAVALTVLGGGAVWLEYSYRPKKESAEEEAKKLFRIKNAQISEIRVFDGARSYSFRCLDLEQKLCKPGDNAKWELTEPSRMRADDANVNSLVSTLNNLSSAETIDLKEDPAEKRSQLLKEYGLAPDSRASAKRVEVRTGDGDSTTVWIGDLHPIGDNYFALSGKQDDKIQLVPSFIKDSFAHDLSFWRDKKIVTLSPNQVKGFTLSGSKGAVSATRLPSGDWNIVSGKQEFQGDIESVDNLISSAVYTTAKQFVSESKTDARARMALAGARPALTIRFSTEADAAQQAPAPGASGTPGASPDVALVFYEKKGGGDRKLYATASNLDPLYEIDSNMLGRLDKSAKDLRLAKLITSMDRFGSKRLEFKGGPLGEPPLVASMGSDGKWAIEGEGGEVSAEKIQGVLDKLSGNRIRDFVADKDVAPGQDKGIQVSVGDASSNEKRKLVFWKTPSALYARDLLNKRPEAFLVDPAIWDALPKARDFFKASPSDKATKRDDPESRIGTSVGHEGHSH